MDGRREAWRRDMLARMGRDPRALNQAPYPGGPGPAMPAPGGYGQRRDLRPGEVNYDLFGPYAHRPAVPHGHRRANSVYKREIPDIFGDAGRRDDEYYGRQPPAPWYPDMYPRAPDRAHGHGHGGVGDHVADEDLQRVIEQLEAADLAAEGRPRPNNGPAPQLPRPANNNDGDNDDDSDAIAESYWPDLRPRLRTEEDLRNLKIDCGICSTTGNSNDFLVLSCGHMLCGTCVERINQECPFCKAKFGERKPKCRRECGGNSEKYGTRLPRTMEEYHTFPLCESEGGGVSAACASCREKNVKERMDSLLRSILNVREGEARVVFVPPGTNIATAEQALEDGFVRLHDMQPLFDSIVNLVTDPEFTRKHTGTSTSAQPRVTTLRGFVAVRKRQPPNN